MAIPFYSDVEFKNDINIKENIIQKGVFINKRNYKNVLQFNCVDSLCCVFIKTKIPAEFSGCMPYIHIYGYDFQWGLLDLSLGFYIYYNKDNGGNITSSYIQDVQYNAINSSHGFPLELTSYQNDSSSPEYIGIKIDFRNFSNNSDNYHMSFVVDCMESVYAKDTSNYYLDWDIDYCKYDENNKPKGYKWYKTSKDDLGVNNSSTRAYNNVVEKTTNDSIIDITHPKETNSNNIINILPNYNNYKKLIIPKQIARELNGYSNTKLGSIGSNVEFKLNSSTESNNDYIPFVLGGVTKGKIGYSSNLKFNPSTGTLIIGSSTMNGSGFSVGSSIIASSSITTDNMKINKDLKFKSESGSEVTLYSTNSNTTSIISDIDKRLTDLGFNEVSTSDNSDYMEKGTLKYNSVKIVTEGRFGEITIDYGTDDSNYQGHYIATPMTEDKTITLKVSKPLSIPSELNINKTISCYIRAMAQGYNKDGTTHVPCVITTDDQHITISITFSKPSSQVGAIYRRVNGKVAFSWSNNIVL